MRNVLIASACIALLLTGCGDDGGSDPVVPLSVPTGLSSAGSLGQIELTWEASTGTGLKGYNIYRSPDGVTFTRLNDQPVEDLLYTDTNVGDGVYYSYKITADNGEESDYSSVVRQMHGTRLDSRYESGCVLGAGDLSPFVVEDTVTVAGDDLQIQSGAELYVLDNAVIDMELATGSPPIMKIIVLGLLRVVSLPTAPATLTAHNADGALQDGTGLALEFGESAIDYDPADGSGTLLQNCLVENLSQGDGAFLVYSCSPRLYNCKITSNKASGGSYLSIYSGSAPIIEHCLITRHTIKIGTDLRGTDALITKNTCRGSYYSLYFFGHNGPGMIDEGQVVQNNFDGDRNGFYMFSVDEGDIPVGNNYWDGGLPDVVGGNGTPVFEPALEAPPADCGPTW
jgi:hypothetical protein